MQCNKNKKSQTYVPLLQMRHLIVFACLAYCDAKVENIEKWKKKISKILKCFLHLKDEKQTNCEKMKMPILFLCH